MNQQVSHSIQDVVKDHSVFCRAVTTTAAVPGQKKRNHIVRLMNQSGNLVPSLIEQQIIDIVSINTLAGLDQINFEVLPKTDSNYRWMLGLHKNADWEHRIIPQICLKNMSTAQVSRIREDFLETISRSLERDSNSTTGNMGGTFCFVEISQYQDEATGTNEHIMTFIFDCNKSAESQMKYNAGEAIEAAFARQNISYLEVANNSPTPNPSATEDDKLLDFSHFRGTTRKGVIGTRGVATTVLDMDQLYRTFLASNMGNEYHALFSQLREQLELGTFDHSYPSPWIRQDYTQHLGEVHQAYSGVDDQAYSGGDDQAYSGGAYSNVAYSGGDDQAYSGVDHQAYSGIHFATSQSASDADITSTVQDMFTQEGREIIQQGQGFGSNNQQGQGFGSNYQQGQGFGSNNHQMGGYASIHFATTAPATELAHVNTIKALADVSYSQE